MEEYDAFAKKLTLPKFDELDGIFEISTIDDATFFLREVRRKMVDKFEGMIKQLDSVLQPDTSLIDIRYSETFSNDDKKNMIEAYKELMYLITCAQELSLDDSDEMNAKYINEALAQYKNVLPQLKQWHARMKEAWKEDTPTIYNEAKYFG